MAIRLIRGSFTGSRLMISRGSWDSRSPGHPQLVLHQLLLRSSAAPIG